MGDPASPNTLSWTVLDELQAKHPPGQSASKEVLLSPSSITTYFHSVVFDALDGVAIHCAALCAKGVVAPSGVDAFCWHHLWTSFCQTSNDCCSSLALVARRLCTDMVDPNGLSVFVACHLIALDKCPGVHLIGVGEVVRIVGKAVLATVKLDILVCFNCILDMLVVRLQFMQCVRCLLRRIEKLLYWWMQVVF